MRIRLLASCVAVLAVPLAAPGEDRSDADSIRSTYESQFVELDADGNGTLDGKELANLAASDLAAFRRHGLPESFPVDREAFVTSGVSMASVTETPASTDGPAATEPDSGRDGKVDEATKSTDTAKASEAAKPGEAAKPADMSKSPDAKPAAAGAAAVIQTRSTTKKSHFVPELPSEFTAHDKNGDGQIALYEWDRKKYSEFIKLDKNGDGFLTPAELLPKGSLKALYAQSSTRVAAGTPTPATAAPAVPGAVTPPAVTGDPDAIDKEARGTFAQMDENKDGSIDESDWGRSRRIRPWFESAGITVSLPMNADTFVANFRRARESGGR